MTHHFKQAIGILGGTFDPIHFGHLRTALEIQQAFNLTEVRLVPCYQPVHRELPIASPEQRLAMVRCAIQHEPTLHVEEYEIYRQVPSYTINTLEALQKKFPHATLCLMMGIDALLGLASWHRYEDILQLAHILVAYRPPYQLPQDGHVAELLKKRLRQSKETIFQSAAGEIVFCPVTALEISATDIRKLIMQNKSPRFLLPDSVYTYIKEHGVYRLSPV